MDGFYGYQYSWSGFVDYSKCYHEVSTFTWLSQVGIWIGTLISAIPQLVKIVQKRTSYGISPLFILLTSLGHFLLNLNVFSLHNPVFIGMPQVPFVGVALRLLTFLNLFTLFILLYPVLPLSVVFFDKEERAHRKRDAFRKEWYSAIAFSTFYLLLMIFMFIAFIVLITQFGIGSYYIGSFGKTFGGISSILSVIHYIPQFIKTCKIKDNGSLSLLMLAIQFPGGLFNGLVMAFGQGEDWTTYSAIMCSALQQGILLALCIYYKCKRKKYSTISSPLLSDTSKSASYTAHTDAISNPL